MPSLLILIPMVGLIALNLPFRKAMTRLAFVSAFVLFLAQIAVAVFHHPVLHPQGLRLGDTFFGTTFPVDHLSFIILICIGIVSLASLIVGRVMIPDPEERFRFINLLIVSAIGMSGIVIANDLFSLYVFLEATSIASFILIAFRKGIDALEGAFKYFILSAIATVMMLFAIGLFLFVAPDTTFASLASAVTASRTSPIVVFAIALFICGLMIKGGLVPFHGWLPDAYMASPAPVSILLAGITTKACGIYTVIRLATLLFGITGAVQDTLLAVATLSIVVGAFTALGQSNFKRMLAYSSISQVGYIILGLGSGTPLGIAGAAFHLFNHAIFKTLLFVNAAAVEQQAGEMDMERLGGLASKMPVTGTTSVVGLLSAAGVPPLAGFWSKILIIIALWGSGRYLYAAIAVMASIVTLAYLLGMQRKVFFGKLAKGFENLREATPAIACVSIALALIIVGVGVCFPIIFERFIMPVQEILAGGGV